MTRFDLHPEDLLERAGRGALNVADRARLEQHLAECAVCRVERALSAQAEVDAQPLRDEKLMLARLKRDVTKHLHTSPAQRTRRKRAVGVLGLLVASAVTVVAAAAAVSLHRGTAFWQTTAAPPPTVTHHSAPQAPALVTPPAPRAEEPVVEVAVPVPSVAPPTKATPLEVTSAAEAFSRANLARRDGKVKEAVRLYRTLQERYAGSSEELVSRVALGRLLLDRLGDSRGALVQFNSYLASPGSGALREEAMVGRALALARLGRSAEERAAWSALLEAWPKSAHAKHARARLVELEGKPSSGTR
jgi:TolA-binding protein